MPPSAFSTSPRVLLWVGDCEPKRAASIKESRMVEQSRISSGLSRHILAFAIALIAKSFPAPTSPRISMCDELSPAAEISSYAFNIAGLVPIAFSGRNSWSILSRKSRFSAFSFSFSSMSRNRTETA